MYKTRRTHKLRSLAGVMAVSVSTVMADVTLDFNYSGPLLNGLQPLTLDFSVDGVGNVTLDASTPSANGLIIAAVDAWDGAVGTISDASLWGTSFTLVGVTGGPGLVVTGNDTGILGISGQAAARIDNNGTEVLTFNASGLGAGAVLDIKTMSYGFRAANGSSNVRVVDTDTTYDTLIPNTSTFGTLDLSGEGLAIGNGEGLGFTTEAFNVGAGYGLAGFTFDAVVIPEPASLGLMGLGGVALLLVRRRTR
jgi:hypothetical protein